MTMPEPPSSTDSTDAPEPSSEASAEPAAEAVDTAPVEADARTTPMSAEAPEKIETPAAAPEPAAPAEAAPAEAAAPAEPAPEAAAPAEAAPAPEATPDPSGSTALGVPLASGEQVFYCFENNVKKAKLIGIVAGSSLILIGLVTMWFMCITVIAIPIGGYILFRGISPAAGTLAGVVLTSSRVLTIPYAEGAAVSEYAVQDIEDVSCKRKGKKVTRKSGLAAMAINAAANAVADHQKDKLGKLHPHYWSGASHMILHMTGGRNATFGIDETQGPVFGPVLMAGVMKGWDSLVPVSFSAKRVQS